MTNNDMDDVTAVKNVGKSLVTTGAAAVLVATIAVGVASADDEQNEQPEADAVEYTIPSND